MNIIANRMFNMLNKFSKKTFSDNVTDSYCGQTNHTLKMYDDDKELGKIEYVVYQEEVHISMISVPQEYQREGVGTKLLQKLQSEFPNIEINWGMTTDNGTALFDATTYTIENKEFSEKFKELEVLKDKLLELERKFDEGTYTESEGDSYNDIYDKVRDLEKELDGKKPTSTLIK